MEIPSFTRLYPGLASGTYYRPGYHDGRWVIGGTLLGSIGIAVTDSNGATWALVNGNFPAAATVCYGAAYGNGVWVAGSSGAGLSVSTDGLTWVSLASQTTQNITSAAYGNGRWVAVGFSGVIRTSLDGYTWNSVSHSLGSAGFWSVWFNGERFVAVGNSTTIAYSDNGLVWTRSSIAPGSDYIRGVHYANGLWVAVGQNGKIYTSPDGATWAGRVHGHSGITPYFWAVTQINGVWLAAGDGGLTSVSDDGIVWTPGPVLAFEARYFTHGDGLVMASGVNYVGIAVAEVIKYLFPVITKDANGVPASRSASLIRESSKTIVHTVMTDAVSGQATLESPYNEPHTLLFSGEPGRNAIVFSGVTPTTQQ